MIKKKWVPKQPKSPPPLNLDQLIRMDKSLRDSSLQPSVA
jgi:hypothetical protein